MLKKFTVENFKGFKEKLVLDLASPCNYEFNSNVVSNGCITKGIVYGINGCGKSNLGHAIFDIVGHLTDNDFLARNYDCYVSMDGKAPFADFEYTFEFQGVELIYSYRKVSSTQLYEERLLIGGREVLYFDFLKQRGHIALEGAETLNNSMNNPSAISRVKYVNSNAILADTSENAVFMDFMDFINRMLLFYSLDDRGYQGFMQGSESIPEGIIKSGKLAEFQGFLEENNIFYELKDVETDGMRSIYCKFDKQDVNFYRVASTGTKSLALFYYWYIKMQQASFVYIDEFDAFYHFELSENIVKHLCKICDTQIFMTTHNTDLMSNDLMRPDCYFLLANNEIRSLANSTEKELRKAHNLQKMYKAGAFDGQ